LKGGCFLLFHQLVGVQLIVIAFFADQLFMGPLFNNAAFVNNQDPIGRADGGKPVGDDKADSPLQGFI